jgi:hypothetical protein
VVGLHAKAFSVDGHDIAVILLPLRCFHHDVVANPQAGGDAFRLSRIGLPPG